MSGLTFAILRAANEARLPQFRNKHGDIGVSRDWTPAQWLQATVGELGEYANVRKKFERGDLTEGEFLEAACAELADVQIYLDLLALAIGIDLGAATVAKFNRVSERVGADTMILLGDGEETVNVKYVTNVMAGASAAHARQAVDESSWHSRADANRYRWMRDPVNANHQAWNRIIATDCAGEEMDKLIDEALAEP